MLYNICEVVMKRKFIIALIISLVVAVFLVPTSLTFAANQYEYYQVNDDNVLFGEYDVETLSFAPRFKLPKTYYIKVNVDSASEQTDFDGKVYKQIVYNGRSGYISTEHFKEGVNKVTKATSSDVAKLTDATAYFKKTILLKKQYVNGAITINQNSELTYMGKNVRNIDTFYYNGNYVSINNTNDEYYEPFTVPNHSFPKENNSNVVTDSSTVNPYNNLLTVILIIGITIPAVAIVFLIFKPVKKRAEYENDDDYYEDYRARYNTKKRK